MHPCSQGIRVEPQDLCSPVLSLDAPPGFHYEDEINILKKEGIDAAFSLYEEVGVGFANPVCAYTDYCKLQDAGLKS